MCHVSGVKCHVSCATCRVSYVTCHLSLTPTAKATDPPPAISPTMHSKFAKTEPQSRKHVKTQKIMETFKKRGSQLCNFRNTLFEQKSPAILVPVADRRYDPKHINGNCILRLNWPRGQFSENPAYMGPHNILTCTDLVRIVAPIPNNPKAFLVSHVSHVICHMSTVTCNRSPDHHSMQLHLLARLREVQ